MRAAALLAMAGGLVACDAALDLGGNDGAGGGGDGSTPASTSTSTSTGPSGSSTTGGSPTTGSSGDGGGGAGGGEGAGGQGGEPGGGGGPVGPCVPPEGVDRLSPVVHLPGVRTLDLAVGDARVAAVLEDDESPVSTVLRLDRASLEVIGESSEPFIGRVAFVGDTLFAADSCGPMRESGDGFVPVVPSCVAGYVTSMTGDATRLVYGEDDRLWSAAADGSGAATLLFERGRAGQLESLFVDVMVDGPVAYVASPEYSETVSSPAGQVWRVALDGSFQQLVAEMPSHWDPENEVFGVGPTSLAVDDEHVYWNDAFEGQVQRARRDFGEPEILFDGEHPVGPLAVAGEEVIFVTALPCGGALIHRIPTAGGEPVPFAFVDHPVGWLEARDGVIYFAAGYTEEADTRIYRESL